MTMIINDAPRKRGFISAEGAEVKNADFTNLATNEYGY
jgi:hypothetical protein